MRRPTSIPCEGMVYGKKGRNARPCAWLGWRRFAVWVALLDGYLIGTPVRASKGDTILSVKVEAETIIINLLPVLFVHRARAASDRPGGGPLLDGGWVSPHTLAHAWIACGRAGPAWYSVFSACYGPDRACRLFAGSRVDARRAWRAQPRRCSRPGGPAPESRESSSRRGGALSLAAPRRQPPKPTSSPSCTRPPTFWSAPASSAPVVADRSQNDKRRPHVSVRVGV